MPDMFVTHLTKRPPYSICVAHAQTFDRCVLGFQHSETALKISRERTDLFLQCYDLFRTQIERELFSESIVRHKKWLLMKQDPCTKDYLCPGSVPCEMWLWARQVEVVWWRLNFVGHLVFHTLAWCLKHLQKVRDEGISHKEYYQYCHLQTECLAFVWFPEPIKRVNKIHV